MIVTGALPLSQYGGEPYENSSGGGFRPRSELITEYIQQAQCAVCRQVELGWNESDYYYIEIEAIRLV